VSVRPYVRMSTKSLFSDFDVIWCLGSRPRPDMRISEISIRCKVKIKVKWLLKFGKLQSSRSMSSAILAWISKLMVVDDSMGPSLQLFRFTNFLLRKLSHELKLHGMSTLHELQMALFPYCLRTESHGWACW